MLRILFTTLLLGMAVCAGVEHNSAGANQGCESNKMENTLAIYQIPPVYPPFPIHPTKTNLQVMDDSSVLC
jgi:hypothetical protein